MHLLFERLPDGFSTVFWWQRECMLKMKHLLGDQRRCDRPFSEKSRGVNCRRPSYNTEISRLGTWDKLQKCTYHRPWTMSDFVGQRSVQGRFLISWRQSRGNKGRQSGAKSITSWQCISSQNTPYTDLSWSEWYTFDRTSTILTKPSSLRFLALSKNKIYHCWKVVFKDPRQW